MCYNMHIRYKMKNYMRLFRTVPFLLIIALICIACEHQQENEDYIPEYENYIKKETWNGFEFRQYKNVTDNQFHITLNKFKTVFNSDSFTDEERVQLKSKIDFIVISYIKSNGNGGIVNYSFIYIFCNSIQSEIEEGLRNILR